ncbi:MAG: metallopeptidase family protein [Planctomycetes bacterium]|nr:metallopeptidase family protein [Planctomycetota bacterium]
MEHEQDYATLDRAWEALDALDAGAALEIAAGASDELAETWVLRATAHLALDDLGAASRCADEAEQREDASEDMELALVRAEIALRAWNFDAARVELARAQALGESPVVLAKLALLADLDGDFGRADRLLRDAQRLDPQGFPSPQRLSESEFDRVLHQSIARLPDEFRAALEHVPVIVEPMPARELCGDDPRETPPDLLGLFTGAPLSESGPESAPDLPPTIHLFQRNLERACNSRRELAEQVEVTLYHELGHYLGFDEDGVSELGLE